MKKRLLTLFLPCVALLLFRCGNGPVEKGEICLRLGDFPMAIAFFSEEVKRHPESFDARLGLGKALLQQGCADVSDTIAWKDAIIQLEAAATLSPRDNVSALLSEAYLQRAHVLLSSKDSIGALDALSRAIERNNRAIEPINLAGIIYFRMGETDKAQALFAKATALDSVNPAARFNLGMVYWQAGRIDDARNQWFAALAASPKDKDIVYWCAVAEKKKRDMAR
jgi:tetratricopeptide (TPR) repeat protein